MEVPSGKKQQLSLQLKKGTKREGESEAESMKQESSVHFPLLTKVQFENLKWTVVPQNTEKTLARALQLLHMWCNGRNKCCEEKVSEDILCTDDMVSLCHWLCVGVSELQKEDRIDYAPQNLSQFII